MKGGCGKTTLSVSLAAALAANQQHKTWKIGIIDCDPQANTTNSLLPQNTEINLSLYDILNKDKFDIDKCFYPTVHERLRLLPNILSTTALEIPLAKTFPESNTLLRDAAWDYLHENFNIVLIDNNPTLGVMLNQSLCISTEAWIVIEAGSRFSMHGIPELIKHIEAIESTSNPNLESMRVVINKLNRKRVADQQNIEAIYKMFGKENVFDSVIPVCADFRMVELKGATTIMQYKNGRTRGAIGMRELAREVFAQME